MTISRYKTYKVQFFIDTKEIAKKEVSNVSSIAQIIASAPKNNDITHCIITEKGNKNRFAEYTMWIGDDGRNHYRIA